MKNHSCVRRPLPTSFRPLLELLETRLTPTTFMVSNLNDAGADSLRQAILDSNAAPGANTIDFSVAGTIQLTSAALPGITDAVDIDGASAPGFSNAPVVELDAHGLAGLVFNSGSANSSLVSLSIVNAAGTGVTLGDSNITVMGNYIGLALDGSTIAANTGDGLQIDASLNDTIGGTEALDRNVISGNTLNGIFIPGGNSNATDNQIIGNFIGTDATGALARGNGADGILILDESSGNTIGGTAVGARNIISGNGGNGIDYITSAFNNTTINNYIGTDVTGTFAIGNKGFGVVHAGQLGETIGGPDPADQNVISGNLSGGIEASAGGLIVGPTQVLGNLIGTDHTGKNGMCPNQVNGHHQSWVPAPASVPATLSRSTPSPASRSMPAPPPFSAIPYSTTVRKASTWKTTAMSSRCHPRSSSTPWNRRDRSPAPLWSK